MAVSKGPRIRDSNGSHTAANNPSTASTVTATATGTYNRLWFRQADRALGQAALDLEGLQQSKAANEQQQSVFITSTRQTVCKDLTKTLLRLMVHSIYIYMYIPCSLETQHKISVHGIIVIVQIQLFVVADEWLLRTVRASIESVLRVVGV